MRRRAIVVGYNMNVGIPTGHIRHEIRSMCGGATVLPVGTIGIELVDEAPTKME